MKDDGSEPLANARHERFAVEVAKGVGSDMTAYVAAGYSQKAAHQNATGLRANAGIMARVAWIQRQAAKSAVLTIEEKRLFIARVLRTPIGEIDETSDLAQGVKYSDEGGKEIKMPDKLRAIAIDNDLAGEGSEAKHLDALTDEIERIRAKK